MPSMEIPIEKKNEYISEETVRAIQEIIADSAILLPLGATVNGYTIKQWLDAFCSYIVKRILSQENRGVEPWDQRQNF